MRGLLAREEVFRESERALESSPPPEALPGRIGRAKGSRSTKRGAGSGDGWLGEKEKATGNPWAEALTDAGPCQPLACAHLCGERKRGESRE